MEKYNLDDKERLLKFFSKKPSKLLLKEDTIELRHFKNFNSLKMHIVDFTDTSVKLQSTDDVADLELAQQDHVVMTYFSNKTYFSIIGNIANIEKTNPLEFVVDIKTIKNTKNLMKAQKKYVSFPGTINVTADADTKATAITKVMGLRAVKVDCKQEYKTGNMVDVLIMLAKNSKLIFKGEIVKKEKNGDLFEYGIEVKEITESNSKLMHQCVDDAID